MTAAFRTFVLILGCSVVASVSPSAQQPMPARGVVDCSLCPLSGQQPAGPGFDESKLKFIEQIRPASHEGQTFEIQIVARVLLTAPITLEALDSRFRMVDRTGRLVRESGRDDGRSCGVLEMDTLSLESKSTIAGLRFNDIITGTIVMQRDETNPDAILAATEVLTDVRKVSGAPTYFHASSSSSCGNRSGRLIEYRGRANDALTIYNNGDIHYRNSLQRQFVQARLTEPELSDLLSAFAAVKFDALPHAVRPLKWSNPPGITLTASRLQDVWLADNDERLAPLVRRMTALTTRAMSSTYFVLKTGTRRRVKVELWPYDAIKLDGFLASRSQASSARASGYQSGPVDARAFAELLPDEFLDRLPPAFPSTPADQTDSIYFAQGGKLFRVGYHRGCQRTPELCKTFYSLEVRELQTIEAALRSQATRTHVLTGYGNAAGATRGATIDPERIADYALTLHGPGPYLWPTETGISLTTLPSSGTRISQADYERHKAMYGALLASQQLGVDLFEDGVLFEHVRVCQMEPGVVDECLVK